MKNDTTKPNLSDYTQQARIHKALANEARLMIVDRLRHGEGTVGSLTKAAGLDQSTVSKHLSVLRSAGIVQRRKEGNRVLYRLLTPCVLDMFACCHQVLQTNIQSLPVLSEVPANQSLVEDWLPPTLELARSKPKNLLFLCVQNSARSQLAEAIARHLTPANVRAYSAGSNPAFVRPEVLQVLKEKGVSTDGLRSKSVEEFDLVDFDAAITLCDEEVCPTFPNEIHHLHWGLPDPAKIDNQDERTAAFRAVRDELWKRIERLMPDETTE